MVDTRVLETRAREGVWVRVPPKAFLIYKHTLKGVQMIPTQLSPENVVIALEDANGEVLTMTMAELGQRFVQQQQNLKQAYDELEHVTAIADALAEDFQEEESEPQEAHYGVITVGSTDGRQTDTKSFEFTDWYSAMNQFILLLQGVGFSIDKEQLREFVDSGTCWAPESQKF